MRWPVALAFVLPALCLYTLFTIYPAIRGLSLSVTNSNGFGASTFVGLANYVQAVHDPDALAGLRNSVVFAVLTTVLQTIAGIGFAVWLGNQPRIRNPLRAALFTPGMLSALIVGYVWSYIYNPLGGGLNALLQAVGLGSWVHTWLGDPHTALLAVVVVNAWMYSGHSAVIFLANYLAIPAEVLESAEMDGASGWQRFWAIEWPMLAPATTINTVVTLISGLRVFELPFIMTGGGPGNATTTLNTLIFQKAFTDHGFGYAAALSVLLLIFILIINGMQTGLLRAREAAL